MLPRIPAPRPRSTCSGAYGALYRWLILFGLIVFGAIVAYREDLLDELFGADESHLSIVILGVFLLASLDAGRRARYLGLELCEAKRLNRHLSTGSQLLRIEPDREIHFVDGRGTDSFAHNHLALLANKSLQRGALGDQTLLLERLENALGRGHETGWFIADLMIRLGLLGTVIGFIFMLSSVAQVSGVDLQTLQQLLTRMSGGMRVALYTTLTGLGAGMLLGLQYRLLDQAVDRLMAEIIELSEVHAAAELRRLIED